VLLFLKDKHGKTYAENTRETIRREVVHYLVQGGVLRSNPDDPSLSTNSPKTHYALSEEALQALQSHDTPHFEARTADFLRAQQGGLAQRHAATRDPHIVPVTLPDGCTLELSPGEHNALQRAIVEHFLPRFAPGARLLYLGDTTRKHLVHEEDALRELGVGLTPHDKLPDLVAWMPDRAWLFLIEAVSSHGPVSPKRREELEGVFASCAAGRVYVSAFLDAKTFKKHFGDLAWDTEVWLAEQPDHLIHLNGDRFLGPREVARARGDKDHG
jgi:hypothetical protein